MKQILIQKNLRANCSIGASFFGMKRYDDCEDSPPILFFAAFQLPPAEDVQLVSTVQHRVCALLKSELESQTESLQKKRMKARLLVITQIIAPNHPIMLMAAWFQWRLSFGKGLFAKNPGNYDYCL